jgi:hypothetical protein
LDKDSKYFVLLDRALDILYVLEDKLDYDNKNVGNAINLLQKELV